MSLCFFGKKLGHINKECSKYTAQHGKKGKLLNFICLEVNLTIVPSDAWWVDTGATTYISATMQDCIRSRVSIDVERYIYVGNVNKAVVETIGVIGILLDNNFSLKLEEIFIVSSFNRT